MVVLGGGYIGCEMAQILQALGVQVTLVVRSRPLQFLDRDILDLMLAEMKHSGMNVLLDSPHDKVEKLSDGQLRVSLSNGTHIDAN